MRILRIIIACVLMFGFVAGTRAATLPSVGSLGIDFREGAWSSCPTPGVDPACTVGNITLTPFPNDPGFFWAADDGFGIADPFWSPGENDEIDGSETLTV